jgi:hypothetical protein
MSTLNAKPNKERMLNTRLLPIAAILLLLLALLFMATPLLRVSGVAGRTGANRQFSGQYVPRSGSGNATSPNGQNAFPTPGTGTQEQGFPGQGNSTYPRQFGGSGSSLLQLSFLSGITGTIVYAIALLVALAAAVGMFITRRWGQILGIVMAVLYFVLALVSFLPTILLGFAGALNGLSLGLDILRLILAVAVIVLALIPAKKAMTPAVSATPATPPAASA